MLEINFTHQAEKYLKKLAKSSSETTAFILRQINGLRQNPIPLGARKLTNHPGYRIRIGNHRVVYEYDDECLYITVIEKRDNVYRKLKR